MRIKVNLSSLKIFLENSGFPTIPGLLPLSKTVNCGTDFGEIMSTVFWGRCLWQIWWWWSSSLTHGLGSRGSRVQTQKNICEYLQMHVRNYICQPRALRWWKILWRKLHSLWSNPHTPCVKFPVRSHLWVYQNASVRLQLKFTTGFTV